LITHTNVPFDKAEHHLVFGLALLLLIIARFCGFSNSS
jgi:hypothetical protein